MEKPTEEISTKFFCSAEWHLVRLHSTLAAPLHSFALHVSKGSGRFYPAIHSLAEYFHAHDQSVGKAIRQLVRAGFLIELNREPGKPVSYRPVPHKEWAQKHPGYCLQKEQTPWNEEGVDPLVTRLYALSDGRLKLHPNYLLGMRRLKLTDDEICDEWRQFYGWKDEPLTGPCKQRRRGWKGAYGRFMVQLRIKAKELKACDRPAPPPLTPVPYVAVGPPPVLVQPTIN